MIDRSALSTDTEDQSQARKSSDFNNQHLRKSTMEPPADMFCTPSLGTQTPLFYSEGHSLQKIQSIFLSSLSKPYS